jgi:hypothetical protein
VQSRPDHVRLHVGQNITNDLLTFSAHYGARNRALNGVPEFNLLIDGRLMADL